MSIYYTFGDIAKRAWMSAVGVRQAVKRGELTPSAVTRGGIQLFSQGEAERFVQVRRERERMRADNGEL